MDKSTAKMLAYFTQISINMIVTILICVFFGNWLDNKLSTNGIILLIMIIIGVLSALRNLYVISMRMSGIKKDDSDDKESE